MESAGQPAFQHGSLILEISTFEAYTDSLLSYANTALFDVSNLL